MPRIWKFGLCGVARLGFVLAMLVPLSSAHASSYSVLHYFSGPDGGVPGAPLISDGSGNLYGTAAVGGKPGICCGVVFKLTTSGSETVVYSFRGIRRHDGAFPDGRLLFDGAGNLYGITDEGGRVCGIFTRGCGTVFKIAPDGTETVLYSFAGKNLRHGAMPRQGLTAGNAGDLYGTTELGGSSTNCGCGTIFKLAPDGTETVLHSFHGGREGTGPASLLVADGTGYLYGAAGGGSGCSGYGCGIIFKLAADGSSYKVIYAFQGGSDGAGPGGLLPDGAGNFYGLTGSGGTGCSGYGCGTVFKLASDGTETVLYSFKGGSNGWGPIGELITDAAGNFYGTTYWGGDTGCYHGGCGTIFELSAAGTESVLHAFGSGNDGKTPYGGLLADGAGNLYGTTSRGGTSGCGSHCGIVFEVTP